MAELVKNIENTLQNSPFNSEQKDQIKQLVKSFSVEQVYWLGGFLTGIHTAKLNGQSVEHGLISDSIDVGQKVAGKKLERPAITILYGSRTGNGEEIAENARRIALSKGFNPVLKDMSKYKLDQLSKEKHALIIVSTHGDGVPPLEAEDMHHFLQNGNAPDLSNLNYSVCSLGDSSYQKFCQTGKDFDMYIEKHGGKKVYQRVDCDVDYEESSESWINESLTAFAGIIKPADIEVNELPNIPSFNKIAYTKKKPFEATMIDRVLLNGRGSNKEIYHIELSLDGSGLDYRPGDSLGVYSVNDERLVNMIINHLKLNPFEKIETYDGNHELGKALTKMYELSMLSIEVMKKYLKLAPNKKLQDLLSERESLERYVYGRDILDLLVDFPVSGITANELVSILRKLPARLYSIASSQTLHPGEVHLTVGAVRYNLNGRERFGVCSTFLADKINPDSKVPVYIEKNKAFKLPNDPQTPIVMVGPGTGIAPFRSFVEERSLIGGNKNWLFFGDQHFNTDFLYQLEWQRYLKNKKIEKLDVAFSRDQKEKIYVQHRMLENSKELYKWIQEGAHIYVCGDEKHMSKDVHNTLIEIIKTEGGITLEKSEEYVKNMQKSKRYQEDVY